MKNKTFTNYINLTHKKADKSAIFLKQRDKFNVYLPIKEVKWSHIQNGESNFSQCRVIIADCYIYASGSWGKKTSLNFFGRITKNNFHSCIFLHLIEMHNEMGPESQILSLKLQYYSIKEPANVDENKDC